ncbi:MAG: GEVED domain-containing protein [Bacteroidota bacterium]
MNYLDKWISSMLIVCLLCCQSIFAQHSGHSHNHSHEHDQAHQHNPDKCGTDHQLESLYQSFPQYLLKKQQIEEHTQRYIQQKNLNGNRDGLGTITVPVVVHVVYNTPQENISDAQILRQMDVLNEDFRRTNSDTTSRWPQADDMEIEFCLASIDPDGLATTGITRTFTTVTSFSGGSNINFDAQGGKTAWPTSEYLNIWVCDLDGGVLGYAIPFGPASRDGVVVGYTNFGSGGTAQAPFNLGRTLTHEVGHWLNLAHMWGSGNGGCGQDDNVGDTPTSTAPYFGCPGVSTSCGSEDMTENYMDYVNDACMHLFTTGQKDRMRAVLAPGGPRASILTSNKCCINSCAIAPEFDIETDNDSVINLSITQLTPGADISVRYRPVSGGAWTTINNVTDSTLRLSQLNRCTDYVIQLRSVCDSIENPFGCYEQRIATLGCCENPVLSAATLTSDSTQFTWNTQYDIDQYAFRYRKLGDLAWNVTGLIDTTIGIGGLDRCQAYEYEIQALCKVGAVAFGETDTLYTGGCGQCEDTLYCVPQVVSNLGWISDVTIGPVQSSNTGFAPGGYDNQSRQEVEMAIDSTYDFSLVAGTSFPYTWRIWMDLDRDGIFNDSTELLYSNDQVANSSITGQIVLGDDIDTGHTRMRVAGRVASSSSPWDACALNGLGEYEDYCVLLTKACNVLTSFEAVIDTSNGLIALNWGQVDAADNYQYEYAIEGDSIWTSFTTSSNSVILGPDSLFGCTRYIFRVKNACDDGEENYLYSDPIKTNCLVGIQPPSARQLAIFPNPAIDILKLISENPIQRVELFDLSGRQVLAKEIHAPEGELSLGGVPRGIYMVKVILQNEVVWERLMVDK